MLEIGTMLSGRYEVLKRVGSGGMADVYMAKDHKLNRNVAVKVLKSEYVEDEKFLKKFETEAQAVARLSHPNIVNVYDVGIEDGINYDSYGHVRSLTRSAGKSLPSPSEINTLFFGYILSESSLLQAP